MRQHGWEKFGVCVAGDVLEEHLDSLASGSGPDEKRHQ